MIRDIDNDKIYLFSPKIDETIIYIISIFIYIFCFFSVLNILRRFRVF